MSLICFLSSSELVDRPWLGWCYWPSRRLLSFLHNKLKITNSCQAVKLRLVQLKLLKLQDQLSMQLNKLKTKMLILLNQAQKMSKLMHKQLNPQKLLLLLKQKLQLPLMLQLMRLILWLGQQSDLKHKHSKENLTEDSMLIMLTFLLTRTIWWFKQSTTLILLGKLILANFKSIMLIMGPIVKSKKLST